MPVMLALMRPTNGGSMQIELLDTFQTRIRGDNDSEYQIYLACADDGTGHSITNGKPLKTYDEWLNS
jgi:hypothetical protein